MNHIEYLREYAKKNSVVLSENIESLDSFFSAMHTLKAAGHTPESIFSVMLHLYSVSLPLTSEGVSILEDHQAQLADLVSMLNTNQRMAK